LLKEEFKNMTLNKPCLAISALSIFVSSVVALSTAIVLSEDAGLTSRQILGTTIFASVASGFAVFIPLEYHNMYHSGMMID